MPPDKDKIIHTISVNDNNDSLHEQPLTSKRDLGTDESESMHSTKFKMKVSHPVIPCSRSPSIPPSRQGTQTYTNVSKRLLFSDTFVFISTCIAFAALTMELSIRLPHLLSNAARMTFSHAWYKYDPSKTFFDTTFLTYGTDYMIFVLMAYASYQCAGATSTSTITKTGITEDRSRLLRLRSAALFACYAISVLAGGYAHQFYVTYEDLETLSFRILWTICVGSVTLAGAWMGLCGTELNRLLLQRSTDEKPVVPTFFSHIPTIPDSCWILYGLYMTCYCMAGGISCFRPAADIFLAGVTQFVPTFYCEIVLGSRLWKDGDYGPSSALTIPRSTRFIYYLGFILNAPLLPLYPYLIHHTNLSLGAVNALLHLNLTISWGMQAVSLYQIGLIFRRLDETMMTTTNPTDSTKSTRVAPNNNSKIH